MKVCNNDKKVKNLLISLGKLPQGIANAGIVNIIVYLDLLSLA